MARDDYGGVLQESEEMQADGGYFGCTSEELQTLMKSKGEGAGKELKEKFGVIEKLCEALKTSVTQGLDPSNVFDMKRRKQHFGSNEIELKKPRNFFSFVYEAIKDQTLIILTIAAFVSIVLAIYESIYSAKKNNVNAYEDSESGLIEGLGISVAVVIIVLVTAGINYNKEKQFNGLQKKLNEQVKCFVLRAGRTTEISAFDILVGDICIIKIGDVIPADGMIVRSVDLLVDESCHTGESDEVHKDSEHDSILYSGTHVIEGSAHMLALAVGEHSQKGAIYSLLGVTYDSINKSEQKKSILHSKLCTVTNCITIGGTVIALLTFAILLIRYCIQNFLVLHKEWSIDHFQNIINFLIIGITILVVAIPEGLPLAVIMALAFSIKKMMRDNNLVRHLDSCETMGSATIICSDKTGTLTTNKMTVGYCFVADKPGAPEDVVVELKDELKELIARSVAFNLGATSQVTEDGFSQTGNKTECALLGFIKLLGCNDAQLIKNGSEASVIKAYSFNSQRKWMGTVVTAASFRGIQEGAHDRNRNEATLVVKGAAEIVFNCCSHIMNENGVPEVLTDLKKSEIVEKNLNKMAENGLRTICLAYKEFTNLPESWNWNEEEKVMNNLTCLALVGIEDPVRPEMALVNFTVQSFKVPNAVAECRRAGIDVIMVTGDHLLTAVYVASKCGLVQDVHEKKDLLSYEKKVKVSESPENTLMVTAAEFNKMVLDKNGNIDQPSFDNVWPRLRVLARATPHDKFMLVSGLMNSRTASQKQIVAVTGDGTNDGPALKKAHVGLCMGISGTEVAKEASDIILLDDNFTSIVRAVVWGRHVHDSIAKFIQFQLTVNLDSPIRGVQMLWVNLLMDTLASLSLAAEEPACDLLKRKPYQSEDSIVSGVMLSKIVGHACYQLAILLLILCFGYRWVGVDAGFSSSSYGRANIHYTFLFNTLVLMTLFNEINCRKIDTSFNVFSGLHRSLLFVIIWTMSFAVQVIIVEFGGSLFSTHPLPPILWAVSLLLGASQLIFGLILTTTLRIVSKIWKKYRTSSKTEYNTMSC
ncbi:hypothetical protein HELRODRAFT_191416 [Helobdella robusta]|uniref:Cation-transporting P-type ATPase N-terminal domain-containing protein n=1 Tax=Helobdella robusta TaxID=6412 RepID=T1FSY8_HELRO|nr:hypothetical protein HELRODRAFT_191416 [Helobdella robusta]ESO05223.1 hypothetical protein HELRODRAFT_191416 [Helobdella robusta]